MPASRQYFSRIALLFFIFFLTASGEGLKTHELTAGQAQDTNVTVPDATPAPIDTSFSDFVKKFSDHELQVITRYPFSPAADKAQQKLSQTQ